MYPERVSDPPGCQAEVVAAEAVCRLQGLSICGQHLVIGMRQSDEHPRQRVGQPILREARVLHGFPGGLQQQSMLRIERGALAFVDTEEFGIEAGDVVDERAPLRHRPTGHPGLRVVVLVGIPPVGRNLGYQVIAPQ